MLFAHGDRVVFIGDSITDAGRSKPIGLPDLSLGCGYVRDINSILQNHNPQQWVEIINMGTNGDTVLHLQKRWKTDVLDLEPDWLSINIGINDVWRQFSPLDLERPIIPQLFEQTYCSLIDTILPSLKGLILITPHYVVSDMADPMRKRMDVYGSIVRRIAQKYDAHFVDTQSAIDEMLVNRDSAELSNDKIHLNEVGHMLLADSVLRVVGVDVLRQGVGTR